MPASRPPSLATRLAILNALLLALLFATVYFYRGLPAPFLFIVAGVLIFPFGLCLVVVPWDSGPSSLVMIAVVAITLSINAFVWGHLVSALWLGLRRKWISPADRLRARGLCPNCGYDLRATPDRCPECGVPITPPPPPAPTAGSGSPPP